MVTTTMKLKKSATHGRKSVCGSDSEGADFRETVTSKEARVDESGVCCKCDDGQAGTANRIGEGEFDPVSYCDDSNGCIAR